MSRESFVANASEFLAGIESVPSVLLEIGLKN